MTAEGISQSAIRRGPLVFRLLFPLVVLLAVVAAPIISIRRGGGLRSAFAYALQRNAAICAAVGVLVALAKREQWIGSEQPASEAGPRYLTRAEPELVYTSDFPGTMSPYRTPFEPDSQGRLFLYFPGRGGLAWTYILEELPTLESLADVQIPQALRRRGSDLWVLETVSVFPAERPRQWPSLHPGPWSNEPAPQAVTGAYVVMGDPQIAFERRNPLIKGTPDLDQATTVAAGFAKSYGVSTCVARVLERRKW